MKLDPTQQADWQIAEAAEAGMKSVQQLADDLGLLPDEIIPMGRSLGKVDQVRVRERTRDTSAGKYVVVTAVTPTPLGEGKTTTTIGLIQGLAKVGKRVTGAIRQPSSGPTFNIKGSGAGGGRAQCIPLAPLSIRLTGDIDSVTNAHNLAMVALTSRMQHERNYDDGRLAKRGLTRLDIDPERVQIGWAIDFCAQALRNITIGQGGKMDGLEMRSWFQISVSSEVMAILALASDLADFRERMARIVVAYDRQGKEVTTRDLGVDGAMSAWMVDAINPNLLQTIEGQPVFVHAGPFANIAIGQSSVIADRLGTRLADYHITEAGFGSDIGFEKFWNLKCRSTGLKPDAVVIVATVRALKHHGGVSAKGPLPDDRGMAALEAGCANLEAHIDIVRRSGVQPVVCINSFYTDTADEIACIRRMAEARGALVALSEHWLKGGDGAVELAEAVVEACERPNNFDYLYDLSAPIVDRIAAVATEIYGADDVRYTDDAAAKIAALEADPAARDLGVCMVKTQLSLSHDPNLLGRPTGWTLPVTDVLVFKGAGFIVPVAGGIKLMPGTGSQPAFRNIDIDVNTGKVEGLF